MCVCAPLAWPVNLGAWHRLPTHETKQMTNKQTNKRTNKRMKRNVAIAIFPVHAAAAAPSPPAAAATTPAAAPAAAFAAHETCV